MLLRTLIAAVAIPFAGFAMHAVRAQSTPPRLSFAPRAAVVGTPVIATGTGLTPNARYALVWHTGAAQWNVQDGKFPEDFGYVHDVELHPADTANATARGGFTVIPHLTIAPVAGRLGTPITITMTGVGYRFYQAVWHLMYDRAQTGWLSAITTHGTARVTIPASGGVGLHTLQAIEGPGQPYLNEQQSPNYQPLIPTVLAATFRVLAGPPTLPGSALVQSLPRARAVVAADPPGPTLTVDYASGVVGSAVTPTGRGFAPNGPVAIGWETLVGNRIADTGWDTVVRPMTSLTTGPDGGFTRVIRTRSDLGGSHRIVAQQRAPGAQAAVDYTLTPSIADLRPGRVRSGSYFLLPMLNVADHPGEHLPAFHLAVFVQ